MFRNFRKKNVRLYQKRNMAAPTIIKSLFKLRYLALVGVSGTVYSLNEYLNEFKEKINNLTIFQMPKLKPDESLNKIDIKKAVVVVVDESITNKPEIINNNEVAEAFVPPNESITDRLDAALNEIINLQRKFQRETDRLEQDIEILKKENNVLNNAISKAGIDTSNYNKKFSKKTLVDQYADVLDKLNEFNSSQYGYKDHLPRVVVIGDQSSGKTSVLEIIAKVRIFPRGTGEMMTKSPIMLTMGEGIDHVAYFNDSPNKVYNLTDENDVERLRNDIETRMNKNILPGKTISNEVVSLSLKGPNIPRMILVDLPGIINTVTKDMSLDSKTSIVDLAKQYMSNPNSIILCVQDGSVDAERSLVTELVQNMDPDGRRTICVLTKLDLAENNQVKEKRIERLFSGQILPMKALGYYAVIAGTGNSDENIDKISHYEESFFKKSYLYKNGAIKPDQAGSQNMILTVSNCFWNMVKNSVEQEADTLRSKAFTLETQWKHSFPDQRELTREQLFERAKNEISDDILKVTNSFKITHIDQIIGEKLWKTIILYAFNKIYLPNAMNGTSVGFKTHVELQLKQWLEHGLTDLSINVAKEFLIDKLLQVFESKKQSEYYELFKPIRDSFVEDFKNQFSWGKNNYESLHILQQASLSDTKIFDRLNWDTSIALLEAVIDEELNRLDTDIKPLVGPAFREQWLKWKSKTPDQIANDHARLELRNYFNVRDPSLRQKLGEDEIISLLSSLHSKGINVKKENIIKIWDNYYYTQFLQKQINLVPICRKNFSIQEFSNHPLECHDIILFWRIHRLIHQTSQALQQQLVNSEAKRFENFAINIIEQYDDETQKKKLLQGKNIDLAEQIAYVSKIKETLDEFINSLRRENIS